MLSIIHRIHPEPSAAHEPWTAAEETYLRQHHATMTTKAMAAALGRSVSAVKTRANILGLRSKHRPWTDDELDWLCAAWPVHGIACAGTFPGRTRQAVAEMARRLRLERVQPVEARAA